MIKLQDISKTFKELVLFKKLSVTFDTGKKTLIRGTNGSGKSVLLKMLVGYSQPDAGTIDIDAFRLHQDGDFIPNAGVSINAPEFMKQWTGMENLLYLAQLGKKADETLIQALADKLALGEDLHKKYKVYSLGMRQKLRIIQALMEKPTYLILDEPFDSLDKSSCTALAEMLQSYLNEDDTRMLIYTDHSNTIVDFADEIFEIDCQNLVSCS